MLLDLGADPRATSGTGWTALHGAAECGSVSAIQMLLEAGADVLVVTRAGKTSLDIAQKYNKQDVIEELLKLGAVSGQNVVKS
jgi:ankyrin repeat protein